MDFGYPGFEASHAYATAHLGLIGDPYREEPVCRGVSMAVDAAVPETNYAWGSEAFRSSEIFGTSLYTGVPSKPGDFTCESTYQFGQLPLDLTPHVTQDACESQAPSADRFAPDDLPPRLPTDTFFQLESTAIRVSAEPFRLGNALLDFLLTVVVCADLKVNRGKFSFKATVSYRGSTSSVKLRVYEVMRGSYVVEFQRRRGDCVVFMELFQKLAAHLHSDPQCSSVASSVLVDAAMEPPVADAVEATDLSLLIDLAAHSKTQPADVLEDVAMAFVRAAQDGQAAPFLRTGSAAMALANLVQDSLESVALPAAKALHALTQNQDAEHFFARHGLIEVVGERLRPTLANSTALLRAVAAELPQRNLPHGSGLKSSTSVAAAAGGSALTGCMVGERCLSLGSS